MLFKPNDLTFLRTHCYCYILHHITNMTTSLSIKTEPGNENQGENNVQFLIKQENVAIEYDSNNENDFNESVNDFSDIGLHNVKNEVADRGNLLCFKPPVKCVVSYERNLDPHEFKCDKCESTFITKQYLMYHVKTEHNRKIECELCKKVFSTQFNLSMHMNGIHYCYDFKCNTCGRAFKLKNALSRHIKTHDSDFVSWNKFKCVVCEKVLTNKINLSTHMQTEHPYFSKFECDKCGKTFKTKYRLSFHIHNHGDSNDLKCNICEKILTTKYNYSRHMKNHNDEFQCALCGKSFSRKNSLKVHVKTIHTDSNDFKCSLCDKVFNLKSNLSRHLKTHVQIDSYYFECDKCGKTFQTKSLLSLHINTHSESHEFECGRCGMQLTTKYFFAQHMKTHNNEVKCTECGKEFSRNSNLLVHMNTVHTDSCDFKCVVCEKAFKLKQNLTRHMKIHLNRS